MSYTQAYRDDVFDLPVEDPSQWIKAVQRGHASIRGNAHKVAHLLLFGTRPEPSGDTVTCPIRLTPERLVGISQVSQVRPEIGYALLRELRGHPDQAAGLAAVLPTVQPHVENWDRIAQALMAGTQDGHLMAWLDHCDWNQAEVEDRKRLFTELAAGGRADVLARLRPQWEREPGVVDALMGHAVPEPDPLKRLEVVRVVMPACPSETAVVQAWIRLAKSDRPDHPHWAQVAQMLPATALGPVAAQILLDRDRCWLSHEGNPIEMEVLADRLGVYATPETQAVLLAAFPGRLPAIDAKQRHRALAGRPATSLGRRQRS